MGNTYSNNKRIAKNTVFLYIRTIITMCISIYTYRVVLDALGIENYGIYNIVGGFVALFAVVSQTMVATTQRYLTFELGKQGNSLVARVFSAAMMVHLVLVVVLLLLFEIIGLWFVNTHLNIPEGKLYATNWIFQFSIFTFLLNIIRSPYEAVVIAYERMGVFAYISIVDAILKLFIAFAILGSSYDRLILYGAYLAILSIIILVVYYAYLRVKLADVKFQFVKEKTLYTNMTRFAGYNFVGASSAIIAKQGTNILINIFFGVAMNAAKGVAEQVEAAVSKFINDFTTAINPQITKSYAGGHTTETVNLSFMGAKFSFYLFCIIGIPLFLQTEYILSLWLKEVPPFAIIFVKLTLLTALINTYANPLTTYAFATGNIKSLSLWLGFIRLLAVPMAYISLLLLPNPIIVLVVLFIIDIILFFVRLSIVSHLMNISIYRFFSEVIICSIIVLSISLFFSIIISHLIKVDNIISFLIFSLISCVMSTSVIYVLGLRNNERKFINDAVRSKVKIER